MHITCNLSEFNLMFRITQLFQNFSCLMGNLHTVFLRMIRISQLSQVFVSFFQICVNFFVFYNFLVCQSFVLLFFRLQSFDCIHPRLQPNRCIFSVSAISFRIFFTTITIVAHLYFNCYPVPIRSILNNCKIFYIFDAVRRGSVTAEKHCKYRWMYLQCLF